MRNWRSCLQVCWWKRSYRWTFPALRAARHLVLLRVEGAGAVTRILAVANQKGGVGKTTTSINLAASLAMAGRRVLLIDLDPQGNATMGSGVDKRLAAATVYHVLLGTRTLAEVRVKASANYDLVPANRELAGAEVELIELPERERRLKEAVRQIQHEYDFVLIDCPPALNLLTVNGLCAAQAVMIPMQCEYYALEGLSDLVQTIKKVRVSLNPGTGNRRVAAHHVRSAQYARAAGLRSAAAALRREGLPHHHPAQHQARGSAKPRDAGAVVGSAIERCARLPGPGR